MGLIGQGLRAIRGEGVRSTLWRAAHFADGRFNPMRRKPTDLYPSDAIAADWTVPRNFNAAEFPERPYDVAWLISPPSRTSGGHQNAFRFMEFLERAGHRLTIHLYQASAQPAVDIPGIRAMMAASSAYPELRADIVRYDPAIGIPPGADVVVSSDWQTAYPAFRYEGPASGSPSCRTSNRGSTRRGGVRPRREHLPVRVSRLLRGTVARRRRSRTSTG